MMDHYTSVKGEFVSSDATDHQSFQDLLHSNSGFVLHQATQGEREKDPTCIPRVLEFNETDTLLGLCHVLTKGNPIAQVDHFLTMVADVQSQTSKKLVLVLQVQNVAVPLKTVEDFIENLHSKTDKYPLLRGTLEFFEKLVGQDDTSVLKECSVLIKRFDDNLTSPLDALPKYLERFANYWKECVMWQKSPLHSIYFKDDQKALLEFWEAQACPELLTVSLQPLTNNPSNFQCISSPAFFNTDDTSSRPYGLDFSYRDSADLFKELLRSKTPEFVIHKITEGRDTLDRACQERAFTIINKSILFGVYHSWSESSPPLSQVYFFLENILEIIKQNKHSYDLKILPALHLEAYEGKFPTFTQVENFIKTFYEITKKLILIYAAPSHLQGMLGSNTDSPLLQNPLWLSKLSKHVGVSQHNQNNDTLHWKNGVYLLQHEAESSQGKYNANYFQGDSNALETFWRSYGLSKVRVENALDLYKVNQTTQTLSLR